MKKIILDLCGGTGAWSKPYSDAGYDVRLVTLPNNDVRTYRHPCAHPCTQFSFARTNAKTDRDLKGAMILVESCLKIIWSIQMEQVSRNAKYTRLKFWALENPYFGLLKNFIGKPAFVFDPYEFGDGYKKRTAIWGNFNEPKKNPVKMTEEMIAKCKTNSRPLPKFDYMKSKDIHPEKFGVFDRQTRRSITPAGFAKAFFDANQ